MPTPRDSAAYRMAPRDEEVDSRGPGFRGLPFAERGRKHWGRAPLLLRTSSFRTKSVDIASSREDPPPSRDPQCAASAWKDTCGVGVPAQGHGAEHYGEERRREPPRQSRGERDD